MGLSDVPFDIILHIAESAGITAVLNLRLVSRSLYEVISSHQDQILPVLVRKYHQLLDEGFEPTALKKSIAAVHSFKQLSRLDLACELAKLRACTRPSRERQTTCPRKELGLGLIGLDLLTRLERGIDVFEEFVKSKAIVIKDEKVQYRLTRSMTLIQQYHEIHNHARPFLDRLSTADIMNYKILYYCAATAIPSNLHCEKCWEESRVQTQSIPQVSPKLFRQSQAVQHISYILMIAKNLLSNVYQATWGSLWSRLRNILSPRPQALTYEERVRDLLRRTAAMDRNQWRQICLPSLLKMKIWDLQKNEHDKAIAFCDEVESFAPLGSKYFEVFWPY